MLLRALRSRRGGGAGLRFFVRLAVGHHVAGAAFRFAFPLGFEFFYELRQRRALLRGAESGFDRRRGLCEGLLAAGRDALDFVDVVAERREQGAAQLVRRRREDGFVERGLELVLLHFLEQASVVLAGGVLGLALGQGGKGLARFDFLFDLFGLC